jgi:hypothetical protein
MTRFGALFGFVVLASPAQACRLHSVWHYPWKQRCPVVAFARLPPHERPALLQRIEVTIPLPRLDDIEWGDRADEQTLGRVLLRAKLDGRL